MIRRARSAVTGRIVKLATAARWPDKTVVELVDRDRVDDRRIRVTVEALGELRPGDTLTAKLPAGSNLAQVQAIRRDLQRWVDERLPGADVIVAAGDVELGVDRRLGDVDVLLRDLEGHVARWDDEGQIARRPDLLDYAQTLAHGITALRYVLDGDPGHGGEEAAAA